jgi:hypothetical protein
MRNTDAIAKIKLVLLPRVENTFLQIINRTICNVCFALVHAVCCKAGHVISIVGQLVVPTQQITGHDSTVLDLTQTVLVYVVQLLARILISR